MGLKEVYESAADQPVRDLTGQWDYIGHAMKKGVIPQPVAVFVEHKQVHGIDTQIQHALTEKQLEEKNRAERQNPNGNSFHNVSQFDQGRDTLDAVKEGLIKPGPGISSAQQFDPVGNMIQALEMSAAP